MDRNREQIIKEIMRLVSELANMGIPVDKTAAGLALQQNSTIRNYKGAIGGIRLLVDEGYFAEPKTLQEVVQKLTENGRYCLRPAISMNLLNLVRERILIRTKMDGKKWRYVIRK